MFTGQRAGADSGPATAAARNTRLGLARAARPLALVVLTGVALFALFLGIYLVKHYAMPLGYDTPRYLFQTTLVAEHGVTGVPKSLPPPSRSLDTRTGFPVVVLTMASLLGASRYAEASVVPAAAAVALALAGGALVSSAVRRREGDLAVVALVLGASLVMVRLLVPETYTDNLLSGALFLAALVPLLSSIRGGHGALASVLLLGVGGLVHPPFLALVLGVVALVGLGLVPASRRAHRVGVPWRSTPAGRVAIVVGGTIVFAAATFAALVRTFPLAPTQTQVELTKKLQQDVPFYQFPVTVPVAVIGLAVLAAAGLGRARRTGDPLPEGATGEGLPAGPRADRGLGARFLLALSLAWGLVTVGGVGLFLAGVGTPAHRFLSFLLPLPLLMGVGIVGIGGLLEARTAAAPSLRWLGPAFVAAAVAASAVAGIRALYVTMPDQRGVEWLQPDKVADAATAARYLDLERVPATAPVVFVIDDTGPNPISFAPEEAYMIRSVLSSARIEHSYFYVGDPLLYLSGRPTNRRTPPSYDVIEAQQWPSVRAILPRHPVALLLASYNPAFSRTVAAHPNWMVSPHVIVLSGPRPLRPVPTPPVPGRPDGPLQGVRVAGGTLALLWLFGLGWALALLPRGCRPFEVAALAPAFGIGALILAGLLLDAVGVRLTGLPAALVGPVAALLAVPALAAPRRRAG